MRKGDIIPRRVRSTRISGKSHQVWYIIKFYTNIFYDSLLNTFYSFVKLRKSFLTLRAMPQIADIHYRDTKS